MTLKKIVNMALNTSRIGLRFFYYAHMGTDATLKVEYVKEDLDNLLTLVSQGLNSSWCVSVRSLT